MRSVCQVRHHFSKITTNTIIFIFFMYLYNFRWVFPAGLKLWKSRWPSALVSLYQVVRLVLFLPPACCVEWKLGDFSGLPQRSLSSCYDGLYMSCCKWKSCYAWVDQAAQMFSPLRCHTRWDFRHQEQYLNCTLCVCAQLVKVFVMTPACLLSLWVWTHAAL